MLEEVEHIHIMESSALFPVYSLTNAISTHPVMREAFKFNNRKHVEKKAAA